MFIPGSIISLLTFPGVIVHEIGHRFFADRAGVPVYKVCYFRFGNPAGYVIHGPVKGLGNAFLISVGPLILNTALCALIGLAAISPTFILYEMSTQGAFLLLLWVGVSIGMHAIPSNEDLQNFVASVRAEKGSGVLTLAAHFFAGFFWLANILRFVWFDAIYAIAISLLLPWALGLF